METQPIQTKFKYLNETQFKKLCAHIAKKPLKAALSGILPGWGTVKDLVPEVYNQTDNDCTANAVALAYRIASKDKQFIPSRRYIYWHERLIEDNNDPNLVQDEGASPIDGLDWLSQHGVCSESLWPYLESNLNSIPPPICENDALKHKIGGSSQLHVNNINAIKQALLRRVSVIAAIAVYESFESETCLKTGVIPIPKPGETLLGYHCLLITGYYDKPSMFTLCNSWSNKVGNGGFFYAKYDYITNPNLTFAVMCIEKF